VLDQKPVLARLAATALRVATFHMDEHPLALHSLALQGKLELALLQALMRIADRLPGACVPQHHGAATVLALWDRAFEAAVLQRMVLDPYREPLVARIGGWPLGHRPTLKHAVQLEPEVVVQPRRIVLLHHEAKGLALGSRDALPFRLSGLREVALRLVIA
jgi:hypothetical protein